MSERLLTAAELAELLALSTSTVLDWFEASRLPGFKLGRVVRFRESDVLMWLETHRVGPSVGGEAPATPSKRPASGVVLQVPATPNLGGEGAS